jgi:hypothetical protein
LPTKFKEKTFKIKWIYESLGLTKQAYYQRVKANKVKEAQQDKVLNLVADYRKTLPKTGTLKLYEYLKPKLMENNIKMGRDAVNDLLRTKDLLIKKQSGFISQQTPNTTTTNHLTY